MAEPGEGGCPVVDGHPLRCDALCRDSSTWTDAERTELAAAFQRMHRHLTSGRGSLPEEWCEPGLPVGDLLEVAAQYAPGEECARLAVTGRQTWRLTAVPSDSEGVRSGG